MAELHALPPEGIRTPALDAAERVDPPGDWFGTRNGIGNGHSNGHTNGHSNGNGSDIGLRSPDRLLHSYPPLADDDEPDATTALLGGGRKRRPLSPLRALSDAQWLNRALEVLTARIVVCGVEIPWVFTLVLLLPLLILIGTISRGPSIPALPLLSNGTHDFHRTTLVVSLDGFRPDYLRSRAEHVPHLAVLAADGVSAQMQPVFPSLTFPNHWSILTGLYPSSHGIMANTFFRPGEGSFDYGSPDTSWQGHWWRGEPLWSVAERKNRRALNFMWPGPPTTSAHISPSFFTQYAQWNSTRKLCELLKYFDKPPSAAPSLMFMYLPDVDQAGHAAGPDSEEVARALRRVDTFVGDLRAGIRQRNLGNIVDLIVLSDHGMTGLSEERIIFLDDVMGDLLGDIEHRDGWPSFGVWFKDGVDYSPHLDALKTAAANKPFSVYTHDTMPERWHLAAPNVAPVYLVPDLGWLLATKADYEHAGGRLTVFGAHGYDNMYPEMQAIFFADGPVASEMKSRAIETMGKGWKTTKPAVMQSFPNLELFNLIARLQDMADYAPPNNGTPHFWDAYLGQQE